MVRPGTIAIAVALVVNALAAQSTQTFEVASVKPQSEPMTFADRATAAPRFRPGGVFNPTHATVQSLVMFAYDLKAYQILGGPEWTRRDLFQIDARAGLDASAEQMKQMVRSLLADRFKLVTRAEQREMSYLALVVARSDGRLGPYLRQLPDECTPAVAAEARKQFPQRPTVDGGGLMSGQCTTLSSMVDLMTAVATREATAPPIVDETRLSGKFVYEMKASSVVPGAVSPAAPADPNLPPFAAALEEQLGLKLQSRKGPVSVLVVDSVQHPTEN